MFRSQRYNYKDSSTKFDREEDCMQRHFYKHFQHTSSCCFFSRFDVTLTEKRVPRAPTKREDYWIHTLNTKVPIGLNFERDY